jgi:uncharacterized protein (TIGR02145 family)
MKIEKGIFRVAMKFILLLLTITGCSSNKTLKPNEVAIGKQVWLKKNLNVDKFRNGQLIPEAKTDEEWLSANKNEKPAWCYYDFDSSNGELFGKLYNWYAVNDSRVLAPEGYHIPTIEEWDKLDKYLGEKESAIKMKTNSGWEIGNGNNESGFSGLPGGYYGIGWDKNFHQKGSNGTWWSSTKEAPNLSLEDDEPFVVRTAGLNALYPRLFSGLISNPFKSANGYSVRCIKD